MDWKQSLDNKDASTFDGQGYSVFLFFPHGVRYETPKGTLTLSSEILFMKDEQGDEERWLRGIYLPTSPYWDAGELITPSELRSILIDLETALREKSERYRFVVNDEVYRSSPSG
jgi:hypothetical protein